MGIKKVKAFTLIEMLVVIAIIGILASLMLPSLRNAVESAYSVGCQNNQKQVYMVYSFYTNEYNNFFMPMGAGVDFPSASYGGSNINLWSWMQGYYESLPTTNWGSDWSRMVLDFFRCPKSNLTKKSYLMDRRRTSYSCFGYVWRFINDRDTRYGSGGGTEGLYRCLRANDIKSPSVTVFYTDSNGQNAGNAVVLPSISDPIYQITTSYVDPGTMAWGAIFLRHGKQNAYNVAYFDGHVKAFTYPDLPVSGGYGWCVSH